MPIQRHKIIGHRGHAFVLHVQHALTVSNQTQGRRGRDSRGTRGRRFVYAQSVFVRYPGVVTATQLLSSAVVRTNRVAETGQRRRYDGHGSWQRWVRRSSYHHRHQPQEARSRTRPQETVQEGQVRTR